MSADAPLVVAIDGPSASGKSTVARLVAERRGLVYVDSGALYRGLTWAALRRHVDPTDGGALEEMLGELDVQFHRSRGAVGFTIDGEDPGVQLRSEPVRESVSDVAACPAVRRYVVERLRTMARYGGIVMEGRDIGSVVFPDTPHKFYLDADPTERARRRHRELVEGEEAADVSQVLESLSRRDRKDTGRKTAPLQIPLGATVVNSTHLDVADVVDLIVNGLPAS